MKMYLKCQKIINPVFVDKYLVIINAFKKPNGNLIISLDMIIHCTLPQRLSYTIYVDIYQHIPYKLTVKPCKH